MVLAGLNKVFVGVELDELKQELTLGKYFVAQLADHAGKHSATRMRHVSQMHLSDSVRCCASWI